MREKYIGRIHGKTLRLERVMDPALLEVRKMYFVECAELLADAAERLTNLSETLDDTDSEEVNAIFRAVHSAKGGGGAWGLTDLAGFAHTFETLLGGVRDGSVPITEEIAEILIDANDALMTLLQNAEQDITSDLSEWKDLVATMEAAIGQADKTEKSGRQVRAEAPSRISPVRHELGPILDNMKAPEVRNSLLICLDESNQIVVNGSKVERVTTLGMQVLLSASLEATERGGSLTLSQPSATLIDGLSALGLGDAIAVE